MTSTGRDDTMTIMGMPDYIPRDHDGSSTLSSAGYEANGGFVFPGQVRKAAPTGKAKTRADRPIKKTPVHGPTVRADDPNRPITGGRVLTPGIYRWDGVDYTIKIGQQSGKPYALDSAGVYVPGIARQLRISDRVGDLPTRRDIPEGLYRVDDDIVFVRTGRTGRKYGSILGDDGFWVFTRGIMAKIDPTKTVTYAEVVAFGLRTGQCMICERRLTNPKSIERGIGPICAGKFGWGHIDDANDSTPAIVMSDESDIEDVTPVQTNSAKWWAAWDRDLAAVDRCIAELPEHTRDSWITVRGLVLESRDELKLRELLNGVEKYLGDIATVESFTPAPADNTPVTGPVIAANGRLDHSGCGHPNTTAARTKCRSEFRRSN